MQNMHRISSALHVITFNHSRPVSPIFQHVTYQLTASLNNK